MIVSARIVDDLAVIAGARIIDFGSSGAVHDVSPEVPIIVVGMSTSLRL